MAKSTKRNKWYFALFRFLAVCLFTGGFIYQTMQFLFLYWTYPTVVDIQQISPSYLEIPSFTFCNPTGYMYDNICDHFAVSPCANSFFAKLTANIVCKQYPFICANGSLPKGFRPIFYGTFMQENQITTEDYPYLALPLEDYLTCTIEFAGTVESCSMDNVLGSFYSTDDLPQFCFTIYSLWGNPNKKRKLIPKGATMKFHLFLNMSRRALDSPDPDGYMGSLHNPPSEPSVQIAVHSPYFLPSPNLEGSSFLGGKAYEMRIKLRESHLMPLPYQTNCTDYMSEWHRRGGRAPINQLSLIQECRVNKTYEAIGCIPLSIDYPHSYNICRSCNPNFKVCQYKEPPNKCTLLADSYNQPCDSMVYEVEKEDKVITLFQKVVSAWASESDGLRVTMTEHDCEGPKMWKIECSTIDIDVPFDRFEITNITYNPKFESLELFSVVGGYMGMWLGISLLTVFDLIGDSIVQLKSFIEARKRKKRFRAKKKVDHDHQNFIMGTQEFQATHYNVW